MYRAGHASSQSVLSHGHLAYKYGDATRVKHEIGMLRHLKDHEGVVNVRAFDVSHSDIGLLITPLAYCDAFRLVHEYTIPRDTKVAFSKFLVLTVAKLHIMGFFHGDIKLEHILVYGDNHFKLCDFQKSGSVRSGNIQDLQSEAYLQPNPYYSPEAFLGFVNMAEQDVWATGIAIFCFWCNLIPPFLAANVGVDQLLTQSFNRENKAKKVPQASNFFGNEKSYIIHNFCKFCQCEGLNHAIYVSQMLAIRENRCTFVSRS
jgi:serine/threonine protein kinase